MIGTISDVSIVVSAILAVAIASVWYSPLFFGRILSKTTEHTFDDSDESRGILLRQIIFGVLVQIVFLIFVAQSIVQSDMEMVALFRLGTTLGGVILATLLSVTIFEKRPLPYFLVHAGYVALVLFGGIFVMAKWPW